MLATFDKDAVRAANPIERVIPDLLGEHPIEGGGELKVRCPWHDDKRPSLRVNAGKDVWRCDVCNIGGDVFEFVQRFEQVSFPEALKFLAERAAIPSAISLGNRNGRTNGNGGRNPAPASVRWPPADVLRWFDYHVESDLVARKVRYDEALAGRKANWLHSRDAGHTWYAGQGCEDPGLYGFEEAVAMPGRTDAVIVAEGERDARRLLELKWPAVSPPHGASLRMRDKWRPAYTERLKAAGFMRAYVIGDHDAAGEGEPGRGNGFNGDIARALNAAGIDARPIPWDASNPAGYDITDFCDQHGADAKARLRERIEAVKTGPAWVDPAPQETVGPTGRGYGAPISASSRAVLTRLSTVPPETVTWLWPGRVARGKLNFLIGDPGLGKSWITLDVIARYTTGRPMPDGEGGGPPGSVILASAEDGAGDTIVPRLSVLGADLSSVYHVNTVTDGRTERGLQLSDIPELENAITETGAGLLVVDPVSAYMGHSDSHRDAEVRGLLAPLAQLADRHRVTVLGVMHLSKNSQRAAIHRASGSVAFTAAARVVCAVAQDPDNEQRRFLGSVKNNLSRPAPTLAFSFPQGRLVPPPRLRQIALNRLTPAGQQFLNDVRALESEIEDPFEDCQSYSPNHPSDGRSMSFLEGCIWPDESRRDTAGVGCTGARAPGRGPRLRYRGARSRHGRHPGPA
jgi:hypothetical protein